MLYDLQFLMLQLGLTGLCLSSIGILNSAYWECMVIGFGPYLLALAYFGFASYFPVQMMLTIYPDDFPYEARLKPTDPPEDTAPPDARPASPATAPTQEEQQAKTPYYESARLGDWLEGGDKIHDPETLLEKAVVRFGDAEKFAPIFGFLYASFVPHDKLKLNMITVQLFKLIVTASLVAAPAGSGFCRISLFILVAIYILLFALLVIFNPYIMQFTYKVQRTIIFLELLFFAMCVLIDHNIIVPPQVLWAIAVLAIIVQARCGGHCFSPPIVSLVARVSWI